MTTTIDDIRAFRRNRKEKRMVADLYEEGQPYELVHDLIQRAHALGATTVEARGVQWHQTPRGPKFQATARIVTAEGCEVRRDGYAEPGDARVEQPADAEHDDMVETRAEVRALRAAIRTAYPDTPLDDGAQPPHIKHIQALLRESAEALGVERDALAEVVHQRYHVASVNDLTAHQCDHCANWLHTIRPQS